ncbi:MAG: galactokinase [Phycisphaerales bacterium]|nr:galactokinase [Phycisphaerales bacterium]
MTAASPGHAAPSLETLRARAAALFEHSFGRPPSMAAQAPGRVNLIGEHTDYNLGHVLPIAIDRWCVVAGSTAEGSQTTVVSDHAPGERAMTDLSSLRPDDLPPRAWSRYALGTLATLASHASRPLPALEIAVVSSVPAGAGLSSSAAIEVALLTLASTLWGVPLQALQTALLAQRAEHTFAGVPCGLMDQMASAMGVADAALLIDCRVNAHRPVPLPSGLAIVVTDSGVRHAHAGGEYAQRRQACRRVTEALGLQALVDASPWALRRFSGEIEPDDLACAAHVASEEQRVLQCATAIQAGDLALAGQLMLASHDSLRRDFRVSCPELDTLVNAAMDVEGVYGSRLTVTLCREEAVEPLRAHLSGAIRAEASREPQSFRVSACPGAGMLA